MDVCILVVETKVKVDFVLEPVMEVVSGNRADGMFVVSCGAVREGKGVKGVRRGRGGKNLEDTTPSTLILELLDLCNGLF